MPARACWRALRQIGPAKYQIVEIAVVQLAKLTQGLPIAELLAGLGPEPGVRA